MQYKIKEIDQGYCRVLYEVKVTNDKKSYSVWYCIQEDFKDQCEFYRCGLGPYYEPMYPAKFKEGAIAEIELPKGDSQLEKAVRDYVTNHPQMRAIEGKY